jgi:hypothetical protein
MRSISWDAFKPRAMAADGPVMVKSQAGFSRARATRRLVAEMWAREGRRTVSAAIALALIVVAVGVFAGFRTRAFLIVEVVAVTLVLGLCARVDASRSGGG